MMGDTYVHYPWQDQTAANLLVPLRSLVSQSWNRDAALDCRAWGILWIGDGVLGQRLVAVGDRESCLRLVSALAMEQSDEWISGRRYLDISLLTEVHHEPLPTALAAD